MASSLRPLIFDEETPFLVNGLFLCAARSLAYLLLKMYLLKGMRVVFSHESLLCPKYGRRSIPFYGAQLYCPMPLTVTDKTNKDRDWRGDPEFGVSVDLKRLHFEGKAVCGGVWAFIKTSERSIDGHSKGQLWPEYADVESGCEIRGRSRSATIVCLSCNYDMRL